MAGALPRVVVVRRRSEYEELLAAHGTRGAAEFFLHTRGQSLGEIEERHELAAAARRAVLAAIPQRWRRAEVLREELPRFLFEPEDAVVCVGQDGLVANVAKYLSGQLVAGVNPDPRSYEGTLVRHAPSGAPDLVHAAFATPRVEERTMVECRIDGVRLLALNEVFLGHRSHQSARYRIHALGSEERQSSSGVVVITGTGATGWGRSLHTSQHSELVLPEPDEPVLAFFVREAWPSVATGTDVVEGRVDHIQLVSEMNDGGVCFGDGIEADHLEFAFAQQATVRVADERLRLMI